MCVCACVSIDACVCVCVCINFEVICVLPWNPVFPLSIVADVGQMILYDKCKLFCSSFCV